MANAYAEMLDGEDFMRFLEDVAEAAKFSGMLSNDQSFAPIAAPVSNIEELYDTDEDAYWKSLKGKSRRELMNLFTTFCERERSSLNAMKDLYALEVVDRILHDRQLCAFIAETLMDIRFDNEAIEGIRFE